MDLKTKRNWFISRNPAIIARHIGYIMWRQLWRTVILSGLHPIGHILNYAICKEMQSRVTAHFHSAVHVKDAPLLNTNSDEEVISFVNRYIACALPDAEQDPELHKLVLSRQTPHHTKTCKKRRN